MINSTTMWWIASGRTERGVGAVKKKWRSLLLVLAMLLTLSGCLFRTPEALYRQPEKSAGYEQLNGVIRTVKSSLGTELGVTVEDASILSGDNTATIQLQDLDGDGRRESAVTFLRAGGVERPMRIYVFTQIGEEFVVTGVVEGEGSSIYTIDYVELNGTGRKELVVNWQINTGAYQLGVYTLDEIPLPGQELDEESQQEELRAMSREDLLGATLLLTRCSVASDGSSGVFPLDMDQDTRTEVAVIRMDSSGINSYVELYGWQEGALTPLDQVPLSTGITELFRIRSNYLAGGYSVPTLYITGTLSDGRRAMDIVAYQGGELANLTLDKTGVSREIVQGYTEVTPTDINDDYVLALPSPSPLPTYGESDSANFWLIDWCQYDENGHRNHVMTTYHNVSDGWYLEIPEDWRDEITISRNDAVTGQREVIFSHWRGEDREPEPFLSIYRLASSRSGELEANGWFVLLEEEGVIYAAQFHPGSWDCGLDEMDLLDRFQTVQSSWYYD